MEIGASFGEWLRRRRKALDLTQEAVAEQVGCSVGLIRKLEGDERRPSRQISELLANVLQVPAHEHDKFIKVARAQLRSDRLETIESIETPFPEVKLPDVELIQGEAATAPSPSSVSSTPPPSLPISPLPIPPTPMLGRERELAALDQLLADSNCRLLTLVGPGGIGKTRLALACGYKEQTSFRDGVCFVSLVGLSSSNYLVSALVNPLGCAISGAADPKLQLLHFLSDRQLLLILDNIEHLLDGIDLLSEMLIAAPLLKLLVTSRERLNIQSEWVFELQGLPVPHHDQTGALEDFSAITLFKESAQRLNRDFKLSSENRAYVMRICQLVDGMPLGIELAAAWVHMLSCQEIAKEIAQNLDFLAVTQRNLPERHRSLRAAFDQSWRLLTATERAILQQLSVFQGGFTRQAAMQVANASLHHLSGLMSKSLLRRSKEGRYELHELVRQFAADYLRQTGGAEQVQLRHAQAFLAFAEQADLQREHGKGRVAAFTNLESERDNLRTALAWSLQPTQSKERQLLGLRLTVLLSEFWYLAGDWNEGRQWLEQALALPLQESVPALYSRALTSLARILHNQAAFDTALAYYRQSLALSQGDDWGRAWTLDLYGLALSRQGKYGEATQVTEESLQLFRKLNDPWGIGQNLIHLANIADEVGHFEEAIRLLEENLRLLQGSPDEANLPVIYITLGSAYTHTGDFARAAETLQAGLAICQRLKLPEGIRWGLTCLGKLMVVQAIPQEAASYFAQSLKISQEMEDRLSSADVLGQLGCVAHLLEDAPRAVCLLAAEDAIRRAMDAPVQDTERQQRQDALAWARQTLGDIRFANEWADGQRLSLEDAITYAQAGIHG